MSAGPLQGYRVVVTRGVDKGDSLPRLLGDAGAIVVSVPLIAPLAIAGDEELRAALARLRARAALVAGRPWLVLTSETAVRLLVAAAGATALVGVAVAVVGPVTAAALRGHGIEAELVAPGQEAESLAAELTALGVAGTAVLVISAAGGRDVIAPVLVEAGAEVEAVAAYRTVIPEGAAQKLRSAFAAPVDAITFTSGSTVRHATRALPAVPPRCVAVCIGPVTARAARDAGWGEVLTAVEHTAAGVVAALIERAGGAHPLP